MDVTTKLHAGKGCVVVCVEEAIRFISNRNTNSCRRKRNASEQIPSAITYVKLGRRQPQRLNHHYYFDAHFFLPINHFR